MARRLGGGARVNLMPVVDDYVACLSGNCAVWHAANSVSAPAGEGMAIRAPRCWNGLRSCGRPRQDDGWAGWAWSAQPEPDTASARVCRTASGPAGGSTRSPGAASYRGPEREFAPPLDVRQHPEPRRISISDAQVKEAEGVVLAFAIALSRAASSQTTVQQYATSDCTATASADYTSTSGTLTMDARSSSASIEAGDRRLAPTKHSVTPSCCW